jgi:hypothetical protein
MYGISQNPVTNNYIMALQHYCIKCNKEYTYSKWCKPCLVNYLKGNFTNWTSKNEKIDNFIQERQLKINDPYDLVFEWISYNQFLDIKEVDRDDFSIIYSAKWKDGPLYWNKINEEYIRQPNKKISLKYLHKLQNIDEFLYKV